MRLGASRTVARFLVAALVYGAAAVAYHEVSGRDGQPPLAGIVGVTVVVAAVLWLLHDPLERLSARVLLGDQADGYQVIRALTQRLAGTLPVDEVAPRVAEAASRATGRSGAEVRLWLTDGERWSQSWPPAAAPIASGASVGVRHAGTAVGEIAVDAVDDATSVDGLSPVSRRLLDDLARPAGLALSTVRLTVELRQRKADLEQLTAALRASRERLLTARVVQQRRMRAEVSARVSPHLVAAIAALSPAGGGATEVEALERTSRKTGAALDELRAIARGIFPPTLSDDGLASSIESWLTRARVEAAVDVPAQLPAIHRHPDLEACLYFSAVTTLAELAAHDATEIRVTLTERPEPLMRVEAVVTGRPGPDTEQLVTDRIEAFGGTVRTWVSGRRYVQTARVPAPGIP